ncbi:XisI protein [Candidatus Poribacteria bacterium]|nr:XisI protein [Candidatus Poribacteria bacterium]
MDTINRYGEIIERLISEYAQFKPAYGEVETETIFDREKGHYEMIRIGWYKDTRIYGCVIHIDIRGDKVWIHHDGTSA